MADIAVVVDAVGWPEAAELESLCSEAIKAVPSATGPIAGELCVLFADDAALQELNATFRNKNRPTNVLSFPVADRSGNRLGDIALGRETVFREAEEKAIPVNHHISHLVIHGALHLLGYDHQTETEAEEMEDLERTALKQLGIADPYKESGNER